MWYILAAVWIRMLMERWRAVLSTLCDRRASVVVCQLRCASKSLRSFVASCRSWTWDGSASGQRRRAAQRPPAPAPAPPATTESTPPPRAPDFPHLVLFVACRRVVISVTVYCTVKMV